MAIAISCACGKRYQVHDRLAGRAVKCVTCGRASVVPNAVAKPADDDDEDSDVLVAEPQQNKPPAGSYSGISADDHLPDEASGNLSVNWLVYWTHRPLWPAVFSLALAVSILGAVIVHPAIGAVTAILAGIAIWLTLKAQKHFRTGHIQPAAVISLSPPLIAVTANLSRKEGRVWRFLKVVEVPLAQLLGEEPRLGMRLAAVSQLLGPEDHEHWLDFKPELIHTVTRSPQQIAAVMQMIPSQQWKRMEYAVRTIPRPLEPGMFRVPHYRPGSGSGYDPKMLMQFANRHLDANPNEGRYVGLKTISPQVLRNALEEIGPGVTAEEVIALIRCDDDTAGLFGIMVTKDSLRFRLTNSLRSDIQWPDLWGVGLTQDALEIVFRPGFRMRLPIARLQKNARRLETFLSAVAESP